MSLGEQIHKYRTEAGLTQEKLAEKLSVSSQAVSSWEQDKYAPDLDKFVELAKALDTTVGRLLEENREPKNTKRLRLFNEERMYTFAKTAATERKLNQTARMMSYAREKHKGQVRKGEQKEVAYINHPLTMICQALSMHIYDDDILCALLLHDVVEDTNTTLEELPVNDETRELVRLMTKDPHPKDKAAAKNVYYAELKKNPKAALVKCFDRVNNLSNMALGFTRDKMVEYVEETEKYIVPLLRVIKNEAPEYADPCWLLSYQMYSLLETYKRLL